MGIPGYLSIWRTDNLESHIWGPHIDTIRRTHRIEEAYHWLEHVGASRLRVIALRTFGAS